MALTKADLELKVQQLEAEIVALNETIESYKTAEREGAPLKLLEAHENTVAEKDQRISDLEDSLVRSDEGAKLLDNEITDLREEVRGLKVSAVAGGDEVVALLELIASDDVKGNEVSSKAREVLDVLAERVDSGAMGNSESDQLPLVDASKLPDEFFREHGIDLHTIPSESGVKRIHWGDTVKLLRMVTLARDASGMGKPGAMVVRLVGIDGEAGTQMTSDLETDAKLVMKGGEYQLIRAR